MRGVRFRYLHPNRRFTKPKRSTRSTIFRAPIALGRGYEGYTEQADNLRATFRDRLRFLPHPKPDQRLLDVGAAAGFFVEQARLAGWIAEGIEPSRWAVAYARDKVGVPVREGILDASSYPLNSFDVITFWEVIEHLPDPSGFLKQVARVAKPGGPGVPFDARFGQHGCPVARAQLARVGGRFREHLFFFDKRSLVRLLDKAGLDVVHARYVTLTVTWPYALERLGVSLGLGRTAFGWALADSPPPECPHSLASTIS